MNNRLTFLKLLALCTFLWVQATQADHFVDQSLNIDHVDCLVCKNIGDPLDSNDAIPTFTDVIFTSNEVTRVSLEAPAFQPKRTDPARAPPASA